jgi:S-adenosylmethionine-dependent methyltransferase
VSAGDVCLDRDAERYAAYLETAAGRLRCDLAFACLEEFLPPLGTPSPRALDLGAGTGEIAVRLARLGFHVTLVDRSPAMLEMSNRTLRRAGLAGRVVLRRGDVAASPPLFPAESFDLVVLHHVLEYTSDPALVLHGAAQMLRRTDTAFVSVVVRNRMGAALAAAVQSADPAIVERVLAAATTEEPCCGGRARLFTAAEVRAFLARASLRPVAERGLRVVFDYLVSHPALEAAGERIAALERTLGAIPEFSAIARYVQFIARPA